MTRRLVPTAFAVLAICMSLVSKAAAAEPELAGNWNITFYLLLPGAGTFPWCNAMCRFHQNRECGGRTQ